MYDFVKNDSELAVLLSHEIAHNELGHMTLNIKKLKESKKWGGLGQIVLGMERFFTTSFNQKQEAEADLLVLIWSTLLIISLVLEFHFSTDSQKMKTNSILQRIYFGLTPIQKIGLNV